MVQEYSNPDLEETLSEIKEDLRRDASGVWLCFDERALSTGGLQISSLAELRQLLGVLDLSKHQVYLNSGGPGGVAAAALLEAVSSLEGCLGLDPLADAARGALLASEEPFRTLTEFASWCCTEAPRMRASLVSTSVYHDAGASPVQELAFALASGTEILRALTNGGLSIDQASSQILFAFSVTGDLFPEISKLRAARQLWWRVASACGATEAAGKMVLHCRTSHRTSTVGDRGVNALRGTVETIAAALGGADTVATASFDEALGVPGAFGRKVAANTQLILREESYLDRVMDPAGGSWFVEEHTKELAAAAWKLFQEIEAESGFVAASREGSIRRRVEEQAQLRQKRLATRKLPITGVSEYPNLREAPYQASEKKAARGPTGESSEVRASTQDRRPGENNLPWMRRLLAAGHSFSAVMAAIQEESLGVLASWPEAALTRRRDSESFEALCRRSEQYRESTGARPKVFLANLGPLRSHRIRASFARNLLAAGGIEAETNEGFVDALACGEAFSSSGAKAAVLCGSDEIYPEMATTVARELSNRGARRVLLAGRPGKLAEEFQEAGIGAFIFQGCDVVAALDSLLTALDVDP